MSIKIVKEKITHAELAALAKERFGDFVKVVVDLDQKILALGGQLHADEEAVLLQQGSKQENLWGFNLYPELQGDDFFEFNSMINIRPSQGNKSRDIDSQEIQEEIKKVVDELYSR